jgi:hypothetical protein
LFLLIIKWVSLAISGDDDFFCIFDSPACKNANAIYAFLDIYGTYTHVEASQ